MEPEFEVQPDGLANLQEGRTYLSSIPDSGRDKTNELALLADTGMTISSLINELGVMVSEAMRQQA